MLAPLSKSDHVVILLQLQIQLLEDKQLPSFRSEHILAATMVHWHHISSVEGVIGMWHAPREWFLDLRSRFVLYSPRKTGKDAPWIKSRIRRAK